MNFDPYFDDLLINDIHSLKLTASFPLKIGHPKRNLVFQSSMFRCELLLSGRVFPTTYNGSVSSPIYKTTNSLGKNPNNTLLKKSKSFKLTIHLSILYILFHSPNIGIAPPKSNIDTQSDGFLDVFPFKHGYLWYLC